MKILLCSAVIAVAVAPPVAHVQAVSSPELPRATFESVERLVMDKMARDKIPGLSIAIVVDGEPVWSNGYGLADVENSVPAAATTIYRTASIGKTMTATAAMQLAERRRMDIDKPVQVYCPAFPKKRWPVTSRHLLGHTSGIRHYGGPRNEEELFNTVHYERVVDALDIFKKDRLRFKPGTKHRYSTFGYNVLGCVVEGASGTDFLTYMRENVFEPAGMTSTRGDDPATINSRRARGYVLTDDGALAISRAVDMSSKMPAGGFVTTAEDLARFAAALMNHRIIALETFEQMLTPVRLKNGEIVPYGLGWGLFPGEDWYGEREAFHGGVTPEVSGMLYLLPDRRFAVALLMNLEAVPERTGLAGEIAKVTLGLGTQVAD